MRRYFLSCPTPGALALAIVAPSSDKQPAEVRLIQRLLLLKDKAVIFQPLSQEKASSYLDHTLHEQAIPYFL